MLLNEFFKFLEGKPIQDYIVKLRYKYSWETDWHYSNEILESSFDLNYIWNNDWNEGYDNVEVLGYTAIADVDVSNNLKEKKQIKNLSDKEKYAICDKYMRDDEGNIISHYCRGLECPLSFTINDSLYCFKDIPTLELIIKEYLDREIDVDT